MITLTLLIILAVITVIVLTICYGWVVFIAADITLATWVIYKIIKHFIKKRD